MTAVGGILPARSTNPTSLDTIVEQRVTALPKSWDLSPNYSDWLPGDLVLLSREPGSPFSLAIEQTQKRFKYEGKHAIWTHAGVYADDGDVIEAVRSTGVRKAALGDTFENRSGNIRRFRSVKTRQQGQSVLDAAVAVAGGDYDRKAIHKIAREAFNLKPRQKVAQPTREELKKFICSTLYEFAILSVFEELIRDEPGLCTTTLPAALAASPKMEPITVGWRSSP